MLTLYQVEWCPFCHAVRQVLTEQMISFVSVPVPADRDERAELAAVTGQRGVPALKDGDRIITGSDEIITYLRRKAGGHEAEAHAARNTWRWTHRMSVSVAAARVRLINVLSKAGFDVIGESDVVVDGAAGSSLVLAVMPAADKAAAVLQADGQSPGGLVFGVTISPQPGGASTVTIADPVAQVWLFADAEVREIAREMRQELRRVIAAL